MRDPSRWLLRYATRGKYYTRVNAQRTFTTVACVNECCRCVSTCQTSFIKRNPTLVRRISSKAVNIGKDNFSLAAFDHPNYENDWNKEEKKEEIIVQHRVQLSDLFVAFVTFTFPSCNEVHGLMHGHRRNAN